MYRIHQMEVAGAQGESGVCISWIPNGLLVERVHKKLDALRCQYESQLSALQGQLDEARGHHKHSMDHSKHSHEEFISPFREKLDGDQKDLLDDLLAKLTSVHQRQIQELEDKYENNVSLEVLALKTTLEQVYQSKSQLEVSAVEAKHEEQLKELQADMEKDYKEKLNLMMAEQNKGILDTSLTDRYNQLVQKISQALDDKIAADIKTSSNKPSNSPSDHDNNNALSQEIRNLLMNQQEEISSLRSQLLGDYESVLQSRTQNMAEQTQEVANLEDQLNALQTQYSEQVASFQDMLASRDDEQKQLSENERNKYEQQQAELKNHFEKKVQDMEASFEKEIHCIKEKYEDQISGLVHARLGSMDTSQDKMEATSHQPAAVDTDSDNADTPRSSATDITVHIQELEKELKDRDSQIQDLNTCLDFNNDEFKKRVDELETELQNAKSACSKLEELVEENKHVIQTLEQEKKESEKLYKDLLEKESPRSKGLAVRDYHSSDSVDDSFSSAREEIQDTPRSIDSNDNSAEASSSSSQKNNDNHAINSEDDKDDEHNHTIPFANDSVESDFTADHSHNENDNNNNNNNNNSNGGSCLQSSSSSLEDQISSLKDQVEDLNRQLEEVKASEKELKSRIEESQHEYLEMIENLRQELDHERQIEVETLQSEFKVQMDVELKRQAAELTQGQEPSQASPQSQAPSKPQAVTIQSDIGIGDKSYPNLETADDDILEASSSSDMFLKTTNFELQTVVLASPPKDDDDDEIEENLSDDSKVTSTKSPSLCSPSHSSSSAVNQSLPLTDMDKEMQAMRDEYEGKIALLSSELERVNEEKKSSELAHQQRLEDLESQLNETEARYDRLMEGVQSGEHPELNELMKDKYDQELELATSLMQTDYDQMLKEEKKKSMEHHRKLMSDFMEDKNNEDEEAEKKHEQDLKDLKERLSSDFETRVQGYQQEIERLNRDLDLLKEASPRESEEGAHDSTLPEIEEITLTMQHQELSCASPGSERSGQSSTALKSPGLSYEDSEEEETEAEKVSTLQVRDFSDAVSAPSPSPYLLKEKEQLELKVQQLTAQVERLTLQLVDRQDSSPVSPLHSPHNTTLKAEDPALITMLQTDLDRISAERESVQTTNDRLLSLLSDTVKTYIGVEDTISRKLTQVVSGGMPPRCQSQQSHRSQGGDSGDGGSGGAGSRAGSVELCGGRHGPNGDSQSSRQGSPAGDFLKGASPDVDTSHDSHALDNTSILSNATDEGLEISQRLAESIFVGPDLDVEGEEILSDARGRLTSAVDQLLELMEQSTVQLHEAKNTQEDLLNTLAMRARDVETTQNRSSELNSQLASEIEAKEYLGLELHKAEGLISGYSADKETNERQIQALEEQREALIVELDSTRSRLEDFQRSQSEIDAVREELSHQQTILRENVGQETQEENRELMLESPQPAPALLNEVSNLNQERRELATQLQHQLDLSRKRLSEMEALAEEAERKHESVVEEKNQNLEDLALQLENTERQLKSSKAFVDELLVEREQEREDHQKEIDKMKETIEGKDRSANSQERMQREIADLTEQLQARIASQTSMHQRIVDLQKVLEDKELGTNDLKVWVSQLEGELDQKFNEEDQLKEKISKLERQLTEKSEGGNEEEMENTIKAVTPRSEESWDSTSATSADVMGSRTSVVSLEEELLKSNETKEELDQENNTLKDQLHDQMLQISGLKNQIDQMRHYATADDSDAAQLRERLAQERDQLEKKEAEIAEAERKIEHLESLLQNRQLEAEEMNSRVSRILEMGDTQEENEKLRNELGELKSQMCEMSSSSSPSSHQLFMPASLLEEKNEEITEMKNRLMEVEAAIGEKAEQVTLNEEKILSLQKSLKNRDEEIVDLQDSLASARRGEACLDMSLPMAEDMGSMLNISMTGRTSIQQEFEDTIAQREGEVHVLEQQIVTLRKELEEAAAKLSDKEEGDEKWKSELSEKEEEVQKLQHELLLVAKENDEMKQSLESFQTEKENQTDQQKMVESLEESVQEKDQELYHLTLEIQELKTQLEEAAQATEAMEKVIGEKDAQLSQAQEERDEKKELLDEKEHKVDQMIIQMEGFQVEISGLTTFQTDLQKDYDTIQSMLDEKEKVLEALTQELSDTKSHQDALESMIQLEAMVASLKKELVEKQNVVDEKEEELYELQDKLEEMGNVKGSIEDKLKQVLKDLETEKKTSSELRDSVETLKKEMDELSEECTSLNEKLDTADTIINEKEYLISNQDEELKMQENKEETMSEKVSILERMLKENNEKSQLGMKLLIADCDKMKVEYNTKISDLEEQLQVQDANYLAMRIASEKDLNQSSELESSKLQTGEKDALLEDLKKQLRELEEQKNESEKLHLEKQSKDMEELDNVKRQLEEMDEQLKYRQSMVLKLQGENERLSDQSPGHDATDGIMKQLEEKDLQVNELEGQLRFRQSALLELEAQRDNLDEEKTEIEQKLKKEVEEKEKELQEILAKYTNLKDGINEEVLHMEQEMQRSSQARVIKKLPTDEEEDVEEMNQLKLESIQKSEELKVKTSRIEDIETELQRKNNELEVRQNLIHDLLEQIESLQLDRAVLESKEKELAKLESMIKQGGVKANEELMTNAENVKTLQLEKNEKTVQSNEQDVGVEEDFVCSQTTTSLNTMPTMNGISEQLPAQSKNQQSHQVLIDQLHQEIQEKNKNMEELNNEIESLKTQIEEQDREILSLKDELDISSASHEVQLLSRDNQISELREAARNLKPSTSVEKVQQSSSDGHALSPQTKEQISHLKTQLRKAHQALEEMQANGDQNTMEREVEERDSVDGGHFANQAELEALRNIVQEQEEELVVLKSRMNNPVVEETIQAKKVDSVESLSRTETPKSSKGPSMDDFSYASNQSNMDGVPPRIQALLDHLHSLGEDLLSASDFEYLQQHLFQQRQVDGDSSDTSAWSRERAALMDTIVAVKDLLQQADRLAAKSVEELSESGDWRSELLDALIQVYQSEREVLKAEVGTANTQYPEMDIVMRLESRIHDLEHVHQRGLDEMLKADRQSLLDEVDSLHHRLLEAKAQLEDTRHSLDSRIAELDKAKSNAEWKLERQIQMLEYKIQQEGVIQEDLKKSLNLERQRVSELSSQSSQERSKTYELQSELSSTQIQLSKVRDALEREQHRFNSVTDALEEEQAKTNHLTDLLDSTKKKLKSLKEDLAHHQAAADSEAVLEQLQRDLEKERQKSYEYSEAEEHAQKQLIQLSEKLDSVKKKLAATKEDYEARIEQLHREWMEREVQDRKEREMESVTKLSDLLDVEREGHKKAMENERNVIRQLRDSLEQVKAENDRLLHLYEVEKSRTDKLKKDVDSNKGSSDMVKHLRTTENEASQLQQKVLELEEELSHVQDRAAALETELSSGHHNGHVTSQMPSGKYHREAIGHLMTASYIDEELKVRLAQCCTRLQMIASKLQDMTGQATDRSQGQGYGDGDDNVDGSETMGLKVVMEELEKLKANIREREEKRQSALEKDRSGQADQLLQHNKQLAEHVKKLKLEKDQMSSAIKKLEGDKKSKIVLPQYTSDVTSDEEGVYDRTVWASEKLSLQMALDSAEHEIQHLRTELRKFTSLTKADGQLMKLDPNKTQRLYGKYLRAESFRKALIYQKKYLLLLLGGYRDTEQETLAILASMGGFPSPRTRTNHATGRPKPLGAFRSAGRAVIAIFRMKYLVRKWKRATRVGSPVMTGLITTQHAYIPNSSSSSYALPHNGQQQPQQQQPYHHHLSNHHHRHLNNSSPSSSPSPSLAINNNNSRVTGNNTSDYVESLTNGGLSSLAAYSNSGNYRTQPSSTSTAAYVPSPSPSSSSHHPSSHQVPSSYLRHQQQQHQHQPQQQQRSHHHNNNSTTPPTKESSKSNHNYKAARGNRDSARRQIFQDGTSDSDSPASRGHARSQPQSSLNNSDDENFMRYLENVQQQLSEGSSSSRRVSWR